MAEEKKKEFVLDKELEVYRDLIDTPTSFSEGFTWTTVAGAIFCGLLMFPGAIYLSLLAGVGIGGAATWVTLIVFSEITRRAMKTMSKQEMVVLLMAAGAMIGGSGPFGQMIWRQYLVTSDAVKDIGLYGRFPAWFSPPPDSAAIVERTFFHPAWIMPIGLLLFMTVVGFVNQFTLGYALFRLTSDVERLPFPMAPVSAQGITALCEGERGERTWRWTAFSVGTMLGLVFGIIHVGLPAVSSAFLDKPIMVIPIPWFELTRVTQSVLPATPTGIIFDLGLILIGFVIPFWALVGSAFSVMFTFILNPILYHTGVLKSWQPGMDTINTQLSNNVDFYFSVNIGIALGIAVCSIYQTVKQLRVSLREARMARAEAGAGAPRISIWSTPKGRGDWPLSWCFIVYFVVAGALVALCKMLVPDFSIIFLVLFAFVYTPLISYVEARLAGIAGQHAGIPFVREGFILLSGVKGVEPWLAPMPINDYGSMAQGFRTFELTGTKFTSQIKLWLLTTPMVFILSFIFWSFLWKDGPIPSALYPYAQRMWELQARNQMIMWSATLGEEGTMTLFQRAFKPELIGVGFGFSSITFIVLSALKWPTMLVYGMARGLSEGLPHGLILQLTGGLVARYWFHKKYGKKAFLRFAPILLAGYFVGVGLIGMAGVALRLIMSAISQSPF